MDHKSSFNNTSWGGVAGWYDDLLKETSNYQKDVILPNLLRLLDIRGGEKILDLACGQGFFSGEFKKAGALVTGVDISAELIEIARKNNKDIEFFVSSADDLKFIKEKSQDKVVAVLAIQNIQNINSVFKEVERILVSDGKFYLILNHPAFRAPKATSWLYDNNKEIQYRRVDSYMSESKTEIDMTPGVEMDKKFTVSFHRPIQFYFKSLKNNGFCITNLEEWLSHKISQPGLRKKAEDRARKEFPMFMMIEAKKV